MPDLKTIDLIAISGKQFSGKDTLADLLLDYMPNFQKIPLAKAIKAEYARQQGITVEDLEANKAQHRPGLIALGDWGRQQDPDYWLKQVLSAPGQKIISDVRLQREYELLRAQGAFLIRLNADHSIRATRGNLVSETDRTETELDAIPNADWDLVLTNNGTPAELDAQLRRVFGIQ